MPDAPAPKPRRAPGQGTQLADGRWQVRHTLPDGTRHAYYGRTLRAAQQAKNDAVRDYEAGQRRDREPGTVAEYLRRWLEEIAAPGVRATVYHRYEINVRVHIAPTLGRIRLADLTPEHVDRMTASKLRSGLAPRTVRNIHATLRNALGAAVRRRILKYNPAAVSAPPRAERVEHRRLSAPEAIAVLEAVRGTPLDSVVTLALTTGLREGELLGLTWRDVDLAGRVVYVRRQVQRIPRQGWQDSEPKSRASRRAVALTEIGAAALVRQRAYVADLQEGARAFGAEWDPERDLVHPNRRGRPIERGNLLRRWYRLLDARGIERLTLHELRHSVATLLLALRTPLKTIQEILGHSQISTTADIYGGEVPALHGDAMAQLDALLASRGDAGASNKASAHSASRLRLIAGNKKPRSP